MSDFPQLVNIFFLTVDFGGRRMRSATMNTRDMVRKVDECNLPRHLRQTLRDLLRFDCSGMDFWPSLDSIAAISGISRTSARNHLRQLLRRKVLKEVLPANTWVEFRGTRYLRHPATYRLNPERLRSRL